MAEVCATQLQVSAAEDNCSPAHSCRDASRLEAVDAQSPPLIRAAPVARPSSARASAGGFRRGAFKRRTVDAAGGPPRSAKTARRPYRSYLLGGNSRDPLNLGAIARGPGSTPVHVQSPVATEPLPTAPSSEPLKVFVAKSARDPLRLSAPADCRRRRRRRRDSLKDSHMAAGSGAAAHSANIAGSFSDSEVTGKGAAFLSPEEPPAKRSRLSFSSCSSRRSRDRVLSPVAPRGSTASDGTLGSAPKSADGALQVVLDVAAPPAELSQAAEPQKKKKDKARFRYGNYNRYYGKRLTDKDADPRLGLLKQEWLAGKDVLDVGCNVGFLAIAIARSFAPRRLVGIDIDGELVGVARKNLRLHLDAAGHFPPSFGREYGPLAAPPLAATPAARSVFPNNVCFKQGNYVLADDAQLEQVKPEYDVILALSISKWVHLNWGDAGLKRFFKRCFRHLRPGGKLILEPQPFSSYKKRKTITPDIMQNFKQMRFKPQHFCDYLLSEEVGFKVCEVAGAPKHSAAGFQRPIQVFTKAADVPPMIAAAPTTG